jgi:hypothetical protein
MNRVIRASKIVEDFFNDHKKDKNTNFDGYFESKFHAVGKLVELYRAAESKAERKNIIQIINRLFKTKMTKKIEQRVMIPLNEPKADKPPTKVEEEEKKKRVGKEKEKKVAVAGSKK